MEIKNQSSINSLTSIPNEVPTAPLFFPYPRIEPQTNNKCRLGCCRVWIAGVANSSFLFFFICPCTRVTHCCVRLLISRIVLKVLSFAFTYCMQAVTDARGELCTIIVVAWGRVNATVAIHNGSEFIFLLPRRRRRCRIYRTIRCFVNWKIWYSFYKILCSFFIHGESIKFVVKQHSKFMSPRGWLSFLSGYRSLREKKILLDLWISHKRALFFLLDFLREKTYVLNKIAGMERLVLSTWSRFQYIRISCYFSRYVRENCLPTEVNWKNFLDFNIRFSSIRNINSLTLYFHNIQADFSNKDRKLITNEVIIHILIIAIMTPSCN